MNQALFDAAVGNAHPEIWPGVSPVELLPATLLSHFQSRKTQQNDACSTGTAVEQGLEKRFWPTSTFL